MNSTLRARIHQLETRHTQTLPVAPIAVGFFPETKQQAIARFLCQTGQQAADAIIVHIIDASLPPDGQRKSESAKSITPP